MAFERNDGQAASQVSFLARFRGYNVFLTSQGATVCSSSPKSQPVVFRLPGANHAREWEATRKLPGIVNYFLGSNPGLWRRNIPTFAQVQCRGVWPGTSVVYRGSCDGQLEIDLIVEPGAEPDRIRLELDGADRLEITSSGDLALHLGQQEVRLRKPVIYQDGVHGRSEVEGGYVLTADGSIAFTLAAYDKQRPLVIDPVLVYSTLLGASTEDRGYSIAVDNAGHAHVVGATQSLNFPTQAPYQPSHGGGRWDGVVAKFNATGSQLLYSTYLGGSRDDFCEAIAIDSDGNACVAGSTRSLDFPTTPGASQETSAGRYDAFAAKLAPDGSDLLFSTLVGGEVDDRARAIAVDASNGVVITGYTRSVDFPVTEGAVQQSLSGESDAFVARLSADGQSLLYSTFLGGTAEDVGTSIAVDTEGAIYAAGHTTSVDLQTTNAAQPAHGGETDAFVAKIASAGDAFEYLTYLGGSGQDATIGCHIAVDHDNAILVTTTMSDDFPTLNALQPALAGLSDIAVARLSGDGSLIFSTYLGGPLQEWAGGVAIDSRGQIVLGGAAAAGFPTVHPIQPDAASGVLGFDAFIAILTGDGSKLLFSTFLGGTAFDGVNGLAVDSRDAIYIAGDSEVGSFPTTIGAFQTDPGGDWDLIVAKISGRVYPYEYAALIVSGIQDDAASRRLARGAYATTVNIHNPNAESVVFFKKLALTFPPAEQRPGAIFPISTDVLEPDQTLKTDGDEIAARLFPDGLPAPVIQGFLVIQSEKPIDVTAVYTTSALDRRGQIAGHSSIHVEQIRERARQADLAIDKTADIVSVVETSDDLFEAEVLYTLSVRNNGPFSAEEITIIDIVTAENSEIEVLEVPVPVLEPAGTFTVESETGTESEIFVVMAALAAGDTATVEFRVRATYTNGMGLVRLINRATVSHALIDPSTQDNSIEIATQLWP